MELMNKAFKWATIIVWSLIIIVIILMLCGLQVIINKHFYNELLLYWLLITYDLFLVCYGAKLAFYNKIFGKIIGILLMLVGSAIFSVTNDTILWLKRYTDCECTYFEKVENETNIIEYIDPHANGYYRQVFLFVYAKCDYVPSK